MRQSSKGVGGGAEYAVVVQTILVSYVAYIVHARLTFDKRYDQIA